jgi:hypothetical protein
MPIYSFRAECRHDVDEFSKTLQGVDPSASFEVKPLLLDSPKGPADVGEVQVEFTTQLSLEMLRVIMRRQIDTHVMIQSMRALPLGQNDLDRDHSIS